MYKNVYVIKDRIAQDELIECQKLKRWPTMLLEPIADLFFAVFGRHLRVNPRKNCMKLYGIDWSQEINMTELQRKLPTEKGALLQNLQVAKRWKTYGLLTKEILKILRQF